MVRQHDCQEWRHKARSNAGKLILIMKKPDLEDFRKAADASQGNYTKIAQFFGVSRQTVYNWCRDDSDFRTVIQDYKMRLYDDALTLGRDEGFTERKDITSNGESIFPKVISLALDEGDGDTEEQNLEV